MSNTTASTSPAVTTSTALKLQISAPALAAASDRARARKITPHAYLNALLEKALQPPIPKDPVASFLQACETLAPHSSDKISFNLPYKHEAEMLKSVIAALIEYLADMPPEDWIKTIRLVQADDHLKRMAELSALRAFAIKLEKEGHVRGLAHIKLKGDEVLANLVDPNTPWIARE